MANDLDKLLRESGRQPEIDRLRAIPGGFEKAQAEFRAGIGQYASESGVQPSLSPSALALPSRAQGGDLDKFLRESGRQSELDAIRATPGGFEKAQADFQAGGGQFAGASSGTGAILPSVQPSINLPQLFEQGIAESGVGELETRLSTMEKSFIEAKGEINDNPFLSEATRVGREAKIEKLFAERTANIRGDIAIKRADVETMLNLQLKQFDIQSQQARDSLNQFNVLLSAGALDNASGEDIANITRSTGISSNMIKSAIQASKKSKEKEISTSTISFDDGVNQGFAVINTQTGEIISKQNVAASKPEKAQKLTASERQNLDTQQNTTNLQGDVQRGALLKDVVQAYTVAGSGLDVDDIYRIYNVNSPHGPAFESIEQVKEGRFGE